MSTTVEATNIHFSGLSVSLRLALAVTLVSWYLIIRTVRLLMTGRKAGFCFPQTSWISE
jgi:hypothetical protein